MGFNPRLNLNGMLNNFYWYSDNPFYQSNYGLPNCTCYAYGRFWEISDPKRIKEICHFRTVANGLNKL